MREPLFTDRLILRDIVEADAELLFDLDSDPEVMRYIGPRLLPDVSSYRDRIRTVHVPRQAHPWHGVRIVLNRASGDFLGWVFIRPAAASDDARKIGWIRPDEVEVGYRYHRSAWGRGIATEAATLACSPKTDPCVMRVSSALRGQETLDERQEAQRGADY
jgi:ribosomal-protein-alanine N-acetyltransferase